MFPYNKNNNAGLSTLTRPGDSRSLAQKSYDKLLHNNSLIKYCKNKQLK